jgi:ABC-type antimicrobial peptide transport system permease subunit
VRIIGDNGLVSYKDRHFEEKNFYFADPEIFEIFTLPLLSGDPETILKDPGNVILSEAMAQKYFGEEEPVGKVITYLGRFPFKVAGIMKNMPRSSHFHADFLDDRYGQLYRAEHKLGQIFGVFSGIAVFIACLGLFGLASYTAEQRTKEIGIRKVLGATVSGIVMMICRWRGW